MIEIPLISAPAQRLNVTINGETYTFKISYNSRMDSATLDILQNGAPLVVGVAMVSGVNLVSQYTLPFDNLWFINTANSRSDPKFEDIGANSKLLILEEGDL